MDNDVQYELELEEEAPVDLEVDEDEPVDLVVEDVIQMIEGTNDYKQLRNKPSINGVTLVGNKTSADLGIDQTYVHRQNVAAAVWSINHNLGKFPSVAVVDSGGSVVVGEVDYVDGNTITLTFRGAFSGVAYLN